MSDINNYYNNIYNLYDDRFMKFHKDYDSRSNHMRMKYLIKLLNITSLLDFGCGVGCWLEEVQKNFSDILGIEISYDAAFPYIKESLKPYIQKGDITSTNMDLGRTFDCVMSIEVAEHIPEELSNQFVKNCIKYSSRLIIITAAPPGQSGTGHINCKPKDFWIKLFEKNNVTFLKGLTEDISIFFNNNIKILFNDKGIIEKNLMIFAKNDLLN